MIAISAFQKKASMAVLDTKVSQRLIDRDWLETMMQKRSNSLRTFI